MSIDNPNKVETENGNTNFAVGPEKKYIDLGEDRSREFPIVGIGASAGGLAAFERFFSNLPPDTGLAYVVVQHLSPPHISILPEILQRYTSMSVFQVTDGILVKPNCVYVIPPNNNLALTDGHLILLKSPEERLQRYPIDYFFRSLADVRGNQSIGIILSGTASDGSLGIKSIKAGGGLTIAQDPETAEFPDMPRNAIATQNVDFIVSPDKMGDLILKYIRHQGLDEFEMDESKVTASRLALQKLYHLLRAKTGLDFSLYKQNTLLRRIERRIKVTLVPDLEAYTNYLQDHPEEVDALFAEMLINVTHFFRDPQAFHALMDKAIRPLIPLKQAAQAPLRVWVTGCSTGEEAYSIAIAVHEQIEAGKADCKVQIFGTDLDAEAIETARRGLYNDISLENVSAERLKRFFNKEERGYQIKKNIRDMVVFSTHNLILDPPFSKMDLICCRNVLIYLEQELQKQIFPMFHYALNPGGILFLGNSESIGGFTDLFSTIDRKNRVFYRKDTPIQSHPIRPRVHSPLVQTTRNRQDPDTRQLAQGGLRELTEKELLRYHAPSCIIIDSKSNILYIHGRTGKYLEPSSGETNAHLLRMAREGLKAELATAIHAAAASKESITRPGIRVKTNGDYQFIDLTIRPVDWEGYPPGLMMVVLEERGGPSDKSQRRGRSQASDGDQVEVLERALKEKDDYLSSIISELEDANQDLKSVNEELMSSNEEMQSTNEELETSKEELQSVNEELSTVNTELQNKNAELTGLNNDVYNLLANTEIGMLFLDLDLQIRRYTPAIQTIYHILPTDIGRPLQHFHANLSYGSLIEDIQEVLTTLIPKATEAKSSDGSWYLVSIKPYRTLENVIDGAVVTFVDITQQKQGDELRRLATVIRDSNDAITVQDFQGKILAWNRGAERMYGWSEPEATAMNVLEMVPEHLREEMIDVLRRFSKGETLRSYETKRVTRSGVMLDIWITCSVLVDDFNRPIGIATTERDITERKQIDQQLRFEYRAMKALTGWFAAFNHAEAIPPARVDEVCQILVSAGYRLAWVGQVKTADAKGIALTSWAGSGAEATLSTKNVQALVKGIQKLAETALASRKPSVARHIPTDPTNKPLQTIARKYRYNSCIVLPLQQDLPLGVLAIYAEEAEAFMDQEMASLWTLSEELSKRINSM